jgi:hypothetical protein
MQSCDWATLNVNQSRRTYIVEHPAFFRTFTLYNPSAICARTLSRGAQCSC